MTKKIVSVFIVLLFTCCVVCAGSFTKGQSDAEKELITEAGLENKASVVEEPANMEAVLKEAVEQGYAVRKGTNYDAKDTVKSIQIVMYSEGQEIKKYNFDEMGNQTGYVLIKRDADGRKIREIGYDSDNEVSSKHTYEYIGNNVITEHRYSYDYRGYYDDYGVYHEDCGIYHEIYHYEYDDQGRKSSMRKGIGEDTTDEVFEVFNITYYFYDEEGRLIREELGEISEEEAVYVAYEYDGPLLLKEETYWMLAGKRYYVDGTEYEYDEEGRMVKCAYYEEDHDLWRYWIYEYLD